LNLVLPQKAASEREHERKLAAKAAEEEKQRLLHQRRLHK